MSEIVSKHHIGKYIDSKLKEKGWVAKDLAAVSGLSETDISNLRSGKTKKLKAEVFYKLHTSFGNNCDEVIKLIYPALDLAMNTVKEEEERTIFGQHMKRREKSINSIKEISLKTGIAKERLYNLYYQDGAIEAYELILIEVAVKAEMGSIFRALYKFKPGKPSPR